jgi:hypothetical protein
MDGLQSVADPSMSARNLVIEGGSPSVGGHKLSARADVEGDVAASSAGTIDSRAGTFEWQVTQRGTLSAKVIEPRNTRNYTEEDGFLSV